MDDARQARALSFGAVAEAYDRLRPGYPGELLDDVLAGVESPRVLEAGAGTGLATVGLAQRGATVLAVEPDPAMAAIARARTADLEVDVLQTTFEECDPADGAFDRVVSAQAWHWVHPLFGARVAAEALAPGGLMCAWWNRPRDFDGPVWAAIHDVYARLAPQLDRSGQLADRGADDTAVPSAIGFSAWERSVYDWERSYGADEYAELIQTHSDVIALETQLRERVVAGVREAIGSAGGALEHRYRCVLLRAAPLS